VFVCVGDPPPGRYGGPPPGARGGPPPAARGGPPGGFGFGGGAPTPQGAGMMQGLTEGGPEEYIHCFRSFVIFSVRH